MYTGFLNRYPGSDLHEIDLAYLLDTVVLLRKDLTEFIKVNSIKYSDPLQWNITTQYEANTVVIDPVSGAAYLSVQPVPSGVSLTNTEYWTEIGNFSELQNTLKEAITGNDAGTAGTTPVALAVNDLIWWNDVLYKATTTLPIGTALIEGSNVEQTDINTELKSLYNLENLIEAEATAREEADTTLQESINAEATAREEADTTLQESINAEATAREEADNDLQEVINNILSNSDFKTYTIQGRTLKCKFEKTGSYQLTDTDKIAFSDLLGTYTGYGLQSCEYIGQNRLLMGLSKSNTYDNSILVTVNTTTMGIIDRINIDLGHCNDLAYDPVRGKVYVATMGTGTRANTITILNSNDLSLETSVATGSEVYKVSYDTVNDIVYDVRNGEGNLILEIRELPSLNVIASYTINGPDIPNLTSQGSTCINGNFYYIDTVYGATGYNAGVYFTNYTPEGEQGKQFAFNSMPGDEAEGVTHDNNYLYIVSYNYVTQNVHFYKYPINNNSSNQLNTILTGYGKGLDEGEDLNGLIDGKYIKVSASINTPNWPPQNSGGTIIQINGGYDHTFQIALLNNGQFYSRTRLTSGSNGSWTPWRNLNGCIMKGYYSFDLAGAYISDGLRLIVGTIPMELFNTPDLSGAVFTVRSVTGSYIVTGANLSDYNYTVTLTNGLARLSIRKADGTAFTGTNNTPVAVNIVVTV